MSLAPAALALVAALAHPNSLSRSVIVVDGARATVELSVQALTVIEELGGDDDGDLEYSTDEWSRVAPRYEAYALEKLALLDRGERLHGRATRLDLARNPDSDALFPMVGQWVLAGLAYEADADLAELAVGFHLFEVTNSAHRDYASVHWNGESEQRFVFALGERIWEHEPWSRQRPLVRRDFAAIGLRGAAGSAVTVALLVALLSGASRRGAALGVATLAAGAAALAAGTALFEPAWLSRVPPAFAGLASALSAAYVATDVLMRKQPRAAWVEAGVFGLAHGLFLGARATRLLPAEPLERAAALGFAGGVLAALVAIGSVAFGVLRALPGEAPGESIEAGEAVAPGEAWLARRPVRVSLCAAAAVIGFAVFGRRAGFL